MRSNNQPTCVMCGDAKRLLPTRHCEECYAGLMEWTRKQPYSYGGVTNCDRRYSDKRRDAKKGQAVMNDIGKADLLAILMTTDVGGM